MKIRSGTGSRRGFFLYPYLTIQQKLPLLICVLLLCVIITFSWVTYVGMKKTALQLGGERLSTLTQQLSSMFQQSARTLTAATRLSAGQEPVKNYLLSAGKKDSAETGAILQKL